jgi:exosortase/archaeosortase family protein
VSRVRVVSALTLGVVGAAGLLFFIQSITRSEARVNGWLVSALGLADAQSVGSAVIFPSDGRWIGFLVTAGCSVALPMLPPLLVASMFLAAGRVSWGRGAFTTGATALLLGAVNQLRLAVVVISMRAWGFEVGYERSHVLIGSAITTTGLVAVTLMFVVVLGGGRRRKPAVPSA